MTLDQFSTDPFIRLQCENTNCSLHQRGDFIPCELKIRSEHLERLDVLFVGEAPGTTEVHINWKRPFVGISGTLLRRALKQAAGDRLYNVGYSNTVRCLPLDNAGEIRKPTPQEIGNCQTFLERDIQLTDPKVIVLLGGSAISGLLPSKSKKVTTERGQYHFMEIAGKQRVVLSTWHPAFVGRQKNVLPIWYDDLKLAFRLADGWLPDPAFAKIGESVLLKNVRDVLEYCDHLQNGLTIDDMVSVDVETKNLNKVYGNKLGMIQFATDIDKAYCIPIDHPQTPFDPVELDQVKMRLRKLFTDPVSFRYWIAHNGKFEQIIIGQHILGPTRSGIPRTFKNVPMIDTMAFAYVLNENKVNAGDDGYGLKDLAKGLLRFFYYDDKTLEARSKGGLLDLPLESTIPYGKPGWAPNLTDYGGMDAYVTQRLFRALKADAFEQKYYKKATAILEHLFGPTYRLLSKIERNGFWANLSHLNTLKDPVKSPIFKRLEEIDKHEIKKFETAKKANKVLALRKSHGNLPMFGESWVLELSKPDHVREWLIEQCGLEALEKTDSGLPSIGKKFFQEYKDTVPEVALVEERRGLAKLATSYVNQLIEYIDPKFRDDPDPETRWHNEDCQDGRVRPDFWFTSTVTGRGSASKPNMQQQVRPDSPVKAAIKSIFQAEQPGVQDSFKIDFKKGPPSLIRPDAAPENCLVQLDFKTNEVRWWCIVSGCPDLARAFNNGKALLDQYRKDPTNKELGKRAELAGDVHKQTASKMYGVDIDKVTKAQRTDTKSIVFGWMFGRGTYAIAAQIHKNKKDTEALVKTFGEGFPAGRDWLWDQPNVARRQWFVESPIGRRRRLPGYLVQGDKDFEDLEDEDRKLVGECNRMAMNSVIQGIASDAAFIGASLFADYIEDHDKPWIVQNVVHDACVYQVPITELEESLAVAEDTFTTKTMSYMTEHWGVDFPCPIEVDFDIGLAWGHLQKWDMTTPSLEKIKASLFAKAA